VKQNADGEKASAKTIATAASSDLFSRPVATTPVIKLTAATPFKRTQWEGEYRVTRTSTIRLVKSHQCIEHKKNQLNYTKSAREHHLNNSYVVPSRDRAPNMGPSLGSPIQGVAPMGGGYRGSSFGTPNSYAAEESVLNGVNHSHKQRSDAAVEASYGTPQHQNQNQQQQQQQYRSRMLLEPTETFDYLPPEVAFHHIIRPYPCFNLVIHAIDQRPLHHRVQHSKE